MAAIGNPELLGVGLFDRGFIKYGDYKLKSEMWSPIYINLRGIGSFDNRPEAILSRKEQLHLRKTAVGAYSDQLDQFGDKDHIMGIPEAASTSSGMIGFAVDESILQLRVKEKQHGIPKNIEGDYMTGERVLLVDDLITDGGAKLQTRKKTEDHGLKVEGVAVLIDREQGGAEQLAAQGLRLEAAIGMGVLIDILAQERRIDAAQTDLLKRYFAGEITEKPAE